MRTGKAQKIRIVRRPIGEAPDWVRDAWIGVELPLVRRSRPREILTVGVLSAPQSVLKQIFWLIRGNGQRISGYAVDAGEAVDQLALSNPPAAAWWRENARHSLREGVGFVFDADACDPSEE